MSTPGAGVRRVRVRHFEADSEVRKRDVVAVEEPLEIRLEHGPTPARETVALAVTMRTPGHDFELAAGFLKGEGILARRDDLLDITYCLGEEKLEQEYNVVSVRLAPGVSFDPGRLERNFYTTSSCGVCGKATLEAVEVRGCAPLPMREGALDEAVVRGLPAALREEQKLFERTGGIHAAGLFTPAGELAVLREDVGRHNAVDKALGVAFLEPARFRPDPFPGDAVLCVSGRASFEIVQKALASGVATVVAVGAPSSLAVELAARFEMTLVGFARADGFNVYTGIARIRGGAGG
ncbi:MAG: formate dehydrogenase accessory sulfurtransferase FdhD [Longimicrobiales bacterium]|nr:formate dehydrogenase accessory sulfurtransferase FdhD [Longimicrobiales bacterium]